MPQDDSLSTVIVRGLAESDLSIKDVSDFFEICGKIKHMEITDDDLHKITFEAEDSFCICLLLDGILLGGKLIHIQPILQNANRSSTSTTFKLGHPVIVHLKKTGHLPDEKLAASLLMKSERMDDLPTIKEKVTYLLGQHDLSTGQKIGIFASAVGLGAAGAIAGGLMGTLLLPGSILVGGVLGIFAGSSSMALTGSLIGRALVGGVGSSSSSSTSSNGSTGGGGQSIPEKYLKNEPASGSSGEEEEEEAEVADNDKAKGK
jgi:hypothetical protein